MCTRSVRRVMQVDAWINAAWQSSFSLICIQHSPLLLWPVWHHWLKILSVYFVTNIAFAFSLNRNRLDNMKFVGCRSTWFGVYNIAMARMTIPHTLMNYHFSRFGHWNQKNTDTYEYGTQIAYHRVMKSKIPIYPSILPLMQEPSPCLRPHPISIW